MTDEPDHALHFETYNINPSEHKAYSIGDLFAVDTDSPP